MVIALLVLVQRDGKTLLIQESQPFCRGKWFLPGGRLEPGESLAEAAVREAREEAGVEVQLQGLLCIDQSIVARGGFRDRLRFVLVGEAVGGSPKQHEDEHSLRAAWLTPEEIAALELRDEVVTRVIALAATRPPLLPISALPVVP
jgi:8-oxo-dGDP phosphatase